METLRQFPDVHVELNADALEIEVYIGGYFLCSSEIKYISKEAKQELFEQEE